MVPGGFPRFPRFQGPRERRWKDGDRPLSIAVLTALSTRDPAASPERQFSVTTAKIDHPIDDAPAARGFLALLPQRSTFMQKVETFVTRLSTKNNFWQKVTSMIWLPYAFHSGIRIKRLDAKRFTAVLPFRRFNRNFYNAMAGAALLGNSEIAGGWYLFSQCGSGYAVVCKEMKYRFLRPCLGPAIYEVVNSEDLKPMLATGEAFNIRLTLQIRQRLKKKGKDLRVGRCEITFHCTPRTAIAKTPGT